MSSLSQATPALASLRVHRTADEIISMDTRDRLSIVSQPRILKLADEQPEDPTEELQAVREVVEQQSFSLVAFRNNMLDARAQHDGVLREFHAQATAIGERLRVFTGGLLKKVRQMNHRS